MVAARWEIFPRDPGSGIPVPAYSTRCLPRGNRRSAPSPSTDRRPATARSRCAPSWV